MTLSPDQEAWIDRARGADILAVAQRAPVDAKLRRQASEYVGPCPLCGGEDRFAVNRKKRVFICRGSAGGDAIAMVQHVAGVEFLAACEIINGEPFPPASHLPPANPDARRQWEAEIAAAAAKRESERIERDELRDREQNEYRERERKIAFDIWRQALPIAASPAEAYLARRGITALPEGVALRFAREVAFFHGEELDELGRRAPRVIWRGPAMLAPIVDGAGIFRAVHVTWLDPNLGALGLDGKPDATFPNHARPNGKAIVIDPASGETLPSKKVRGSKKGNVIRLAGPAAVPVDAAPDGSPAVSAATLPNSTLYLGEGIETVLSVWTALRAAGRDLARDYFYSAVDLGNLGGKALASVAHPALKTEKGRARRVEGPDPDPAAEGLTLPAGASDVVLLGDGDSDPFTTRCALYRAQARFTAAGRNVRCAFAPAGMDFNDLLLRECGPYVGSPANTEALSTLYCITDGERTKIGHSSNPDRRRQNLATASPRPLSPATRLFTAARSDVEKVERIAHDLLRAVFDHHLEWFQASPDKVMNVIGHLFAK